ncbi:MAG: hypothetical protein RL095_3487 [Verrucomicrobiota bacterium]|jgi:hypothetical protein
MNKSLPLFGALILSLAMAIFGVMILKDTVFLPLIRAHEAKSWTPTPCKILSAEIQTIPHRRHRPSFKAQIRYEYQIAGQTLIGDMVHCGNPVSDHDADKWIGRYPVASAQSCLVDPANGINAVLSGDHGISATDPIFGSLFLGFSLVMLVAISRFLWKSLPRRPKFNGGRHDRNGRPAKFF